MIRGIVILIFRRAMQRIIELTLRLFLQFGLRFEMATSSVATASSNTPTATASPVPNREITATAVTTSASMSLRQSPPLSLQSRASNERDHRALAMLMFLGCRLPGILGGAGKVSFLEYFATRRVEQPTDNTDTALFRTRMGTGITAFHTTVARNATQSLMTTPLSASDHGEKNNCSAIVVVCMPWEPAKTVDAFCECLSKATGSDVMHVVVPIGTAHPPMSAQRHAAAHTAGGSGAALANATVEGLLQRMAAASSASACTSLCIVSSALAAAVALHAVVRAPFQDGLVPIRGIVLVDPFVSVDATSGVHPVAAPHVHAHAADAPAVAPSVAATPSAAFFDPSSIKKMVVDGAARACVAASSGGDDGGPDKKPQSVLTQWFPPPLDDAFTIPILVIYDVDGLWVEEMKAYFTRWPGCHFLVESVPYRLHPSGTHPGRLFFPSSRSSWVTSELEVASAHMVLWLQDVVSPWEDAAGQSGSSRPVSGCSTPWSHCPPHARRQSLLQRDPQRISVDSMEGVFSGFNESSLTGLPPPPFYMGKAAGTGQLCRRSPGGGFAILTPQLWNPPPGDTLPPSSSAGANLDSLGFQPPQVLANIPHVASRSAVSDEGLGSSATTS